MIFPRWMYHPVKGGQVFNSKQELDAAEKKSPGWVDHPNMFKNPPPDAVTSEQAEGTKDQDKGKHPFTEKDIKTGLKANLYKIAKEYFELPVEDFDTETVKKLRAKILEAMAESKKPEGESKKQEGES